MPKTLLTGIIAVKNLRQASNEIKRVKSQVDCLELRCDFLQPFSIKTIEQLMAAVDVPIILTLRSKKQGGHYEGTDIQQIELIKQLILLNPDYIDLEVDLSKTQITMIAQQLKTTKIVLSNHNFNDTSEDLSDIFKVMQHDAVSIYKIITFANTTLDSLNMLNFVNDISKNHAVIGHCMGAYGECSRLIGAVLGNWFTYAAVNPNEQVAPGQITLTDFINIYKIREKNTETRCYALIGDPISHSIGHVFHNNYFHEHHINALYVKMHVTPDILSDFAFKIKELPLDGLSVTMPLKKAALPFVETDKTNKVVNTVKIANQQRTAINTDGLGAVKALLDVTTLENKNILLVGAGGSATAIAESLALHNIKLTIANRSLDNAGALAKTVGATFITFATHCTTSFDIVINTLPTAAFNAQALMAWFAALIINDDALIMDINYNQNTSPLATLNKPFIDGNTMYRYQALAQQAYWWNDQSAQLTSRQKSPAKLNHHQQ